MPPKSRGRPGTTKAFDIITIEESSDSSVIMTGTKPVRGAKGKGNGKGKTSSSAVPDVYQEMLDKVLPMQSDAPERPLKRRRTGRREDHGTASNARQSHLEQDDLDDEDLEFEDVLVKKNSGQSDSRESDEQAKPLQTAYRDSDDESGSEYDWEAIDFDTRPQDEPSADLELTLTARPTSQRPTAPRRKVATKTERALRLQVHKMHILCLLSYMDRRNNWCNDSEVQSSLKPLLSKKMLTFLKPRSDLSQFGQAESLKRGLEDVSVMWRTKFSITARGLRRSLWADDEKDLQNVGILSFPHNCLF
jgi:xeroderma pigmentosum group C-complementing protein